jgi:hypothetical protein
MAENINETVTERFPQPEHHAAKALAIRTEQVGIGHDRHRVRRVSTAHVVPRGIDGTQ